MSITFHIPGPLRTFAGGHAEVLLEGSYPVLRDALEALWQKHPGLRDRILTEGGQIREHVNLFLGNESIRYTGGLATPLFPAAEIAIIPAISGG
jgi:molybdopterin converting factor small subunit